MFSKSKVYQDQADNCTDGIVIPMSFFDLMPKKEVESMLDLHEMREKNLGDQVVSSGLLVSVNSIVTHLNVDSNIYHKNFNNHLAEQMSDLR